jgi:hypothetical protein
MKRFLLFFSCLAFFSACKFNTATQVESENAEINVQPVIWEIQSADTSIVFTDSLASFIKQQNLHDFTLQRWKNHYLLFGQTLQVDSVDHHLKRSFSKASFKLYDDLYYNFNRMLCADVNQAEEWRHYILTANLVADTILQKEYMQYHANQFTEWPEVSQGFCNASFQQLIMFRNGRQLMLVISIPKSNTLEELNHKTLENNPRMIEWNQIMAKYQEGIVGTNKGETWVMFNELKNSN